MVVLLYPTIAPHGFLVLIETVTLSWLGSFPTAVVTVTPFDPLVKPFSLVSVCAVVYALLPTFSGRKTAPPSAAASAAFWARVEIDCQRLYSIARPANAVRATNVSANHTM